VLTIFPKIKKGRKPIRFLPFFYKSVRSNVYDLFFISVRVSLIENMTIMSSQYNLTKIGPTNTIRSPYKKLWEYMANKPERIHPTTPTQKRT
jgi:hypothetical protein